MSTPNVPLRKEFEYEVPGTPEQVWAAISTGTGLSSWFVPAEVEGGVGGKSRLDMGGGIISTGVVTAWEPPHRLRFEEPDWAPFDTPQPVSPLANEWLVETKGGSTILRIVTSAMGTGADWENEFFEGMESGWPYWVASLRLYLSRHAGETPSLVTAVATLPGAFDAVLARLRDALGATKEGATVDTRGITGTVAMIAKTGDLLVEVDGPVPGSIGIWGFPGADSANVRLTGHFFGAGADAYVARESARWQEWLESAAG